MNKNHFGFALAVAMLGAGLPTVASGASAASGFATYDAVVALDNCSGSLVRFPGAADSDKAVVLTNGHCLPAMPSPDTYQANKAVNRTVTLFGGNDAHTVSKLTLDRLMYATMTGTDVSIYRSTMTYAQLKANYGVNARVLRTTHPSDGTAIDVPSGYWKQHYSCAIDGFVYRLDEGGYEMKDSIRYSDCQTPHGSSGSPVIDTATGQVIGINNTGNDDGERCTMDNPCEIDEAGNVRVEKGQSYAQETYQIATCVTGSTVDLSKRGCQLYGADDSTPSDPTPPAPGADLIVNGGFENGTEGWSGTTGAITTSSARPAHGGSAKAWLGGNGRASSESLQQSVTVPAGAVKPTLTYWIRIDTDETDDVAYDIFKTQIISGSNTSTVTTSSNRDAGPAYVRKSVDLSAYKGKTITVRFAETEDDDAATSFVLDDVALATN